MKRFLIRFQGYKNGWVGKSEIFTLTVTAPSLEEAKQKLLDTHVVDKVNYHRELK